ATPRQPSTLDRAVVTLASHTDLTISITYQITEKVLDDVHPTESRAGDPPNAGVDTAVFTYHLEPQYSLVKEHPDLLPRRLSPLGSHHQVFQVTCERFIARRNVRQPSRRLKLYDRNHNPVRRKVSHRMTLRHPL